ncbi:uncharacterized protein LOC101746932 [Bombyx mori]|uniref:Uncharacterized protein n=1 Tax=Bombyx mori TaxID=7091 RepID=A0A8R2AF24_BOMMO|nr:uncharacterized protein LOC101746932 [Bombyx mori]
MVAVLILFTVFPTLILCSGQGNIQLLEDEISIALKSCAITDLGAGTRQKRSNNLYNNGGLDGNSKQTSKKYILERRNTDGRREQIYKINTTDDDFENDAPNEKQWFSFSSPQMGGAHHYNSRKLYRAKRNEPLFNKSDTDQCLSQCVFANLQVVDPHGIPREAELWNLVQSSITSQQSRAALHDQIHACFQELQSETEDNGCSYSNKLEKCLMLRFAERKEKNMKSRNSN